MAPWRCCKWKILWIGIEKFPGYLESRLSGVNFNGSLRCISRFILVCTLHQIVIFLFLFFNRKILNFSSLIFVKYIRFCLEKREKKEDSYVSVAEVFLYCITKKVILYKILCT